MLSRYKIYRGYRPSEDPLPEGLRQDTRKHTLHCLRPTEEIVIKYLSNPTDEGWDEYKKEYLRILEERFVTDREPFDMLAIQAGMFDVYIGCNCPTKKNPNVEHCHTMLALQFMKEKYEHLEVHKF
jgi:hypothetical protein